MDECRGCPSPCASLSHYIQLPAFIRLCWLWQCGMEPASARWISLMVPWGIIRTQWESITECRPCCADSLLRVINGELQWQTEGHGELLLFLKYLQYKLNVCINQYLYKERMRARVLTPVLKVCPILGLFFLLSVHNQIITRGGAPADENVWERDAFCLVVSRCGEQFSMVGMLRFNPVVSIFQAKGFELPSLVNAFITNAMGVSSLSY